MDFKFKILYWLAILSIIVLISIISIVYESATIMQSIP